MIKSSFKWSSAACAMVSIIIGDMPGRNPPTCVFNTLAVLPTRSYLLANLDRTCETAIENQVSKDTPHLAKSGCRISTGTTRFGQHAVE